MRVLSPSPESLAEASKALRQGGLVVIPTETVYGLAGRAEDEGAVAAIFRLKGRPSENPLIVHVASLESAARFAEFDDRARSLADVFWPGPLTLVLALRTGHSLAPAVSAGLGTVAVRMPQHVITEALISSVGPLAAPSANHFMRLSPSRAQDVDPELGDLLVIDGGPCKVGIESTVLNLVEDASILRQGMIGAAEIGAVIGPLAGRVHGGRSPGQYPRHYSPKTPVLLRTCLDANDAGLTFSEPSNPNQRHMPREPSSYAASLYRALADLDRLGLEVIVIELPPESLDWSAIHDRLRRAAGDG